MTDENTTTDDQQQTEDQADDVQGTVDQADNPDAVRNLIDREREAAKSAKRERDELARKVKQFEDRDKTDQQRLEEKTAASDRRAEDAERRLLRFEVAASKGVPIGQAHRLHGDTRDEIEADADEFAKSLRDSNPAPDFDGGARKPVEKQNFDSAIRRAAGRDT